MLSKDLINQIDSLGSDGWIVDQKKKVKSFLSELLSDGLPPPEVGAKDERIFVQWNDLGIAINFRYHDWLEIYMIASHYPSGFSLFDVYRPEQINNLLTKHWQYEEVLEIKKYMMELYAKTL